MLPFGRSTRWTTGMMCKIGVRIPAHEVAILRAKKGRPRHALAKYDMPRNVRILYNGRLCPPELPLPMGDLDLPCNTWCFRPMRVLNANGTSIGSVVFAQMTATCLYFTMVCLFPPSKLSLPMLASGPHVIRGSLGPPKSGTQMATWSFQPFFAGLTSVTDWQSDRQTDRPPYSVRCGVIMRNCGISQRHKVVSC